MFFEKGMTVNDLKKIVDKAIDAGFEDATVLVQADADGISDIVVNGYEGHGYSLGGDEKIFSLVSVKDEKQYKNIYGDPNM